MNYLDEVKEAFVEKKKEFKAIAIICFFLFIGSIVLFVMSACASGNTDRAAALVVGTFFSILAGSLFLTSLIEYNSRKRRYNLWNGIYTRYTRFKMECEKIDKLCEQIEKTEKALKELKKSKIANIKYLEELAK